MAWLPDGEKNLEDIFIRFGATHERDRRTPGDGIYRAYAYASRGKNSIKFCSAVFYCLRRCPTKTPRTNTFRS